MAWGRAAYPEYEPSGFDELVFSGSISGKTILQIGSSPSGFCNEAIKRGASFATVIDPSPLRSEQARDALATQETSRGYINADFEEWPADEKSYDIVVCANALHHFYDPVGALRKMMRITRERILLEFPTPAFSRRWRELPFRLMPGIPLILMDTKSTTIESAAERTFLFTISALRKIFNEHTQAFEPLRILERSKKGRVAIEARRRNIGHLVVVAGVACIGKTRFIDALFQSDSLRERFGIAKAGLETINAFKIRSLPSRPLPNLILHYDILRPFGRHLERHSRDPVFHLLNCAERLTFITLIQSHDVIVNRSIASGESSKRRAQLAKHYDKKNFLKVWHQAWFDAISSMSEPALSHHIILAGDDYPKIAKDAALTMLR
jgi:ubiquinone/menaquinone biosynthesis C-methylase UbiE